MQKYVKLISLRSGSKNMYGNYNNLFIIIRLFTTYINYRNIIR